MMKLHNDPSHPNSRESAVPVSRRLRNALNRAGQGMTEYILIIGLIALLVFAGVKLFGTNLNSIFTQANTDLQNIKIPSDT